MAATDDRKEPQMFTVVDIHTGEAVNNGTPEQPGDPLLWDRREDAEQWAVDNGCTGPDYRIDEVEG